MKRLAIGLVGLPLFAVVVAMALAMTPGVRQARANHIPYAVGDVFAGVGTGFIKHFDSSGTLLETLDTGTTCNEQLGMAFDAPGNLYATSSFGSCFGAGQVVKFNNQGGLIGPFGSGYSTSTESIAIDGLGKVYVGQPDGTSDILCFNPAGTPCTPNASFDVAVESRGSDWIDLASDQCTMFYTSEGSSVKRFDVCTNTQLPDFATGLTGPCFALRIRANGEVMVTCESQTYRLNSDGSANTTYTIPGTSLLFAMNLDPDGAHFWTGDYFSGDVFRVNIATGAGTAAPVFNANKITRLSGLAVFGEPRPSLPTAICPNGFTTQQDVQNALVAATFSPPGWTVTAVMAATVFTVPIQDVLTHVPVSGLPAGYWNYLQAYGPSGSPPNGVCWAQAAGFTTLQSGVNFYVTNGYMPKTGSIHLLVYGGMFIWMECGNWSSNGTPVPITPITPVTPVTPITPVTPVTPITPVTPVTPITPITPTTPVTPSSVGGISLDPGAGALPLRSQLSSGSNAWLVEVITGTAAAAVALAIAAWYVSRRRVQ